MGKDVILVETVGVGQDEVDVIRLAHTSIVVVTAEMGDGIEEPRSKLRGMFCRAALLRQT